MSTTGKDGTARNTLYAIKSMETMGFQRILTTFEVESHIPPMGTLNADGNRTSDVDSGDCATTGFDKDEPFAGGFWFIEGKSAISDADESNKTEATDLNDTVIPTSYYKGRTTHSGSLELWERANEAVWYGAFNGDWISGQRRYEDHPEYRRFEIWMLMNPNRLDTGATTADRLVKLMGVTFDSNSITHENPIKISAPFSYIRKQIYSNWVQPAQATLRTGSPLPASRVVELNTDLLDDDLTVSNKVHTRLQIAFTIATAPLVAGATITVSGKDPFQNVVNEVIVLPAVPIGTFTTFCHSYLEGPVVLTFGSTFVVANTTDVTVKDIDFRITSTLDANGVPTYELPA